MSANLGHWIWLKQHKNIENTFCTMILILIISSSEPANGHSDECKSVSSRCVYTAKYLRIFSNSVKVQHIYHFYNCKIIMMLWSLILVTKFECSVPHHSDNSIHKNHQAKSTWILRIQALILFKGISSSSDMALGI